jgi:hypothetical protein
MPIEVLAVAIGLVCVVLIAIVSMVGPRDPDEGGPWDRSRDRD